MKVKIPGRSKLGMEEIPGNGRRMQAGKGE